MHPIKDQLVDSSRMIADMVTAYIGDDQDKFDEIIEIMQKDQYPMAMRAARVAYFVSLKHPVLIRKHISNLIGMLSASKIDGIKRGVLKIMADTTIRIEDDELGELTELAFTFVQDAREKIAVRALSIEVLERIIRYYPELKPEFIAVLESMPSDISVALKGKCKKVLKRLKK